MSTIPLLVLISGKQGSGKSTLGSSLASEFGQFSNLSKFAAPLYKIHNAVLEILESYNIPLKESRKYGDFLQYLGTDFGRKNFGMDVWVKCAIIDLQKELKLRTGSCLIHIIDDLRFKTEFTAFDSYPTLKVRLEAPAEIRKKRCPAWRDNEAHASEIDLDNWIDKFDLIVDTSNKDEEETLAIVKRAVEKKLTSLLEIVETKNLGV